ncbi:NGG1p interacting factor NIF3 [Proteobacteria bacterium 005FR1]|nr:NGG1p interacting factor NIF3 [Proteobacteria bacterium 005FR1]
MYKLCFFVPEDHAEAVKKAIFATGAGKIGDYDSCCWQTAGQGQFRPLAGSQPFIGQQGEVEKVTEYKVELVCDEQHMAAALQALLGAHPYEEPAYDIIELVDPARFKA